VQARPAPAPVAVEPVPEAMVWKSGGRATSGWPRPTAAGRRARRRRQHRLCWAPRSPCCWSVRHWRWRMRSREGATCGGDRLCGDERSHQSRRPRTESPRCVETWGAGQTARRRARRPARQRGAPREAWMRVVLRSSPPKAVR
jgi:hypothetical protein